MGKIKITYVERKFHYFVSVEKVFRLVADALPRDEFETTFRQLPFLNTFGGMLKNLMRFRPDAGADIYHITGHCHYIALVLPPERTVLTIHDLGFLHTRKGFRRWVLKKLLLDLPVNRLRYVTAISAATRDEIVRHLPAAGRKVRVIDDPLDKAFVSDEGRPFNGECPNILQIGTSANKNVENMVRALAGLPCRLTLVGKVDEGLRELLARLGVSYTERSELDAEELKSEYASADIVAFCSTYEGFGLPIIEAQAMRTPVLTSDLVPMRDVAGGGAELVDPLKPESIRRGINRIVSDETHRHMLIERGLENVKRFDAARIAEDYAGLYREMIAAREKA